MLVFFLLVFCVHGGIPPPAIVDGEDLEDRINRIACPLNFEEKHDELAWELIWNDPVWLVYFFC